MYHTQLTICNKNNKPIGTHQCLPWSSSKNIFSIAQATKNAPNPSPRPGNILLTLAIGNISGWYLHASNLAHGSLRGTFAFFAPSILEVRVEVAYSTLYKFQSFSCDMSMFELCFQTLARPTSRTKRPIGHTRKRLPKLTSFQ